MPRYPDSVIGRREAAAELMGILSRQEKKKNKTASKSEAGTKKTRKKSKG